MGIRAKFIIITLILTSLSIVGIGLASYSFSKEAAVKEASEKGQIIFNSMLSIQKNFVKNQRPVLQQVLDKDKFFPELQSGAVITRMVWDVFKQDKTDLVFKQAAVDPHNISNKADDFETKLIEKFRSNRDLKREEGQVMREGKAFYYSATPRVAEKGCIMCHGDPAAAPKDQVQKYGDKGGYGWNEGDVPAAFVVYIPLEEAFAAAKKNTLVLLGIGVGGLLVTLLGVWIFLDRSVVSPIVRLAGRTEEISLGKNLNDKVSEAAGGEISILAGSIERLRISLVKILKRNAQS